MAYATLDDLIHHAGEDEILQVADRDGDGVADGAVIDAALSRADERINAWIGARYRLPLTLIPEIVRGWAIAIARYHLHRDGAPEHVIKDYDDAIRELQAAGAGKLSLPGVSGNEPAATTGGGISFASDEPVFTPENLGGFL